MRCRLNALPEEKRHLVAVFTVPLVWPELPLSETILGTLDKMSLLKGVMAKTGVGAGIMDKCAFVHISSLTVTGCKLHPPRLIFR